MEMFNIDVAIECFLNARHSVSSEMLHAESAPLRKSAGVRSTSNGDKRVKDMKSGNRSYEPRPPATESSLPIDGHREGILRKISKDRVIIIHGEVIRSFSTF